VIERKHRTARPKIASHLRTPRICGCNARASCAQNLRILPKSSFRQTLAHRRSSLRCRRRMAAKRHPSYKAIRRSALFQPLVFHAPGTKKLKDGNIRTSLTIGEAGCEPRVCRSNLPQKQSGSNITPIPLSAHKSRNPNTLTHRHQSRSLPNPTDELSPIFVTLARFPWPRPNVRTMPPAPVLAKPGSSLPSTFQSGAVCRNKLAGHDWTARPHKSLSAHLTVVLRKTGREIFTQPPAASPHHLSQG